MSHHRTGGHAVKILFLGANGRDTPHLQLEREVKAIRAEIDLAQAKHIIALCPYGAVESSELSRWLLEEKPDVVHFSGHGVLMRAERPAFGGITREFGSVAPFVAENGAQSALLFETSEGHSAQVSCHVLAELFRIEKTVRCVVLNACFSAADADKIAEHVDCVIGMARAIEDRSALAFAKGFYRGIVYGKTVLEAFHLGITTIRIDDLSGADIPRFHVRSAELADVRLVVPHAPSQPPGALTPPNAPVIEDMQVIPNNEEEQLRLDRAVALHAEDDVGTDSARIFRHRLLNLPERRFTVEALRAVPSLLARYYPGLARPLLPGYDGFDFRDFAKRYRNKVVHRCQDHRLLGLPPTQLRREDLQAKISLSSLFVQLRFRPDKDGAHRMSLADLLVARKNVVVLGDPGMGKSTLLGFLALLFAGGAKLDGFSPSLPTVPMLVSLRDFVHEQRRRREELRFIDYLALRASTDYQLSSSHWAFFDATLRMGEAVVFFDGLDEVGGDNARVDITRKIVAFQDEYPHVPIWVTSRVYGYTPIVALPAGKFDHVRIQDLDDDQVDDFLERWYRLQFPDNPREREDLRQSLHEAVFRTPRVRRLAGCPLLLTLMAFIHRVVQSLPQDRAELYDQCVKMLLDTWQQARRGPVHEIEQHPFEKLNLHISIQKDYLAHLALFIQEKNEAADSEDARGIIDRADALECLAKRHYDVAGRSRPHLRLNEAREEIGHFLDYIGDRTGLLLDRGGGKLSFIHLSFQEYLAAWLFILDPSAHDNPAFFKQHLGKQAWEEVLLLRLYVIRRMEGGGGERVFDAVTSAVFRELERAESAEGWLTLLRALRDNLDFTAPQQEAILNAAIGKWLEAPQLSGPWFTALEEVRFFSEKIAPALRNHLASRQARAKAREAIACLHLEASLFGLTTDAAERFRDRSDVSALLPDLVAFFADPGFATLLAKKASEDDWVAALSAFDGRDVFGMTLGWATGMIECPVEGDQPMDGATRWMKRKIAEEAASRVAFADVQPRSGLTPMFGTCGSICVGDEPCRIKTPLAGKFIPAHSFRHDVSLERPLFWPALAVERVAKSSDGRLPLEKALAERAQTWIQQWLAGFPSQSMRLPSEIAELSRSFGGSFGRSFVREFVQDFGRSFVRRFASRSEDFFTRGFIRNFVCYFGRSFIRYFVREFGRTFVREYGATHGCDFIRGVVIDRDSGILSDLGREFGRQFGKQLGVRVDAPNVVEQFERAMQDELKVHSLLKEDPFWDWLFFSILPKVALSSDTVDRIEVATPTNPFAIPLLLANLFTGAALQHVFCLGRHFIGLSPENNDVPDELLTEWLYRHPVDVHPTAWAWEEHAKALEKTQGSLRGPHGALAMLHAEYVALMTGIQLEETSSTWKNLVAHRAPEVDVLVAYAKRPTSISSPPVAFNSTTSRTSDAPLSVGGGETTLSWIHLSDLHIGHTDGKRRAMLSRILKSLRDDACDHGELGIARIDAIVVAGDIAWNGKSDQYEEARDYLLKMADAVGVPPDRVFVVPGNHDVDRDANNKVVKNIVASLREKGAGTIDDDLADADIKSLLARRQAAYLEFAAAFAPLNAMPPPEARLHWSHSLDAHDGRRVRLIGLNTALFAGDKVDRGRLHVGMASLRETLHGVDDCSELVILISHHPLSGGWLADERDVEREARSRVHLHLCGHVHDAESEDHRRGGGTGMIRIATGTMRTEVGASVEYGYNLTCVLPELNGDGYRVRIHPRRFSNRNGDFRSDTEALPRRTRVPWYEHEIPRIGRKQSARLEEKS